MFKDFGTRPAKTLLSIILPIAACQSVLAQSPCGPNGLRDPSKPGQAGGCGGNKPAPPKQNGNPSSTQSGGGGVQAPPPVNPAGPTAAILWVDMGNRNITNERQSVPAGKAIHILQSCGPAPDGSKPTLATWTTPRSLTAGFVATESAGFLREIGKVNGPNKEFDDTHYLAKDAITVYGAFTGGHPPVRLTCTDSKGRSNVAQTTFDITGPVLKSPAVPPRPGQTPIITVTAGLPDVAIGSFSGTSAGRLGPSGLHPLQGVAYPPLGMILDADVKNLPAGSQLVWMQVIDRSAIERVDKQGHIQRCAATPGLDSQLPYPSDTPGRMIDSPGVRLDKDKFTQEKIGFSARAYLMWQANAAETFVPIAVVEWQFDGRAKVKVPTVLSKLDPFDSGWEVLPGSLSSESVKAVAAFEDFPRWNRLLHGDDSLKNCVPASP